MATSISKGQPAQTASGVEESFSAASTSSAQAETGSSLKTHPDAKPTKTEESTCCLVSCFVSIKNCFVGFFEWFCSLFSSTDAEFEKIFKTVPSELVAKLDTAPSEDARAWGKFVFVSGAVSRALKDRYKIPVSEKRGWGKELSLSADQAWLYLFDLNKTCKPLLDYHKKLGGKPMVSTDAVTIMMDDKQLMQFVAEAKPFLVKGYKQLKNPMPTTLTKDQRAEVGKMIKEVPASGPSLFTFIEEELSPAVADSLLKCAHGNRNNPGV